LVTTGLRERKKLEVRERIAHAAFWLFFERGFDNVTVAEVAAQAETSVQTVFNYFPTKEDLLLNGRRINEGMFLAAIADRPKGLSVIEAARRRVMAAADEFSRFDPVRANQFRSIVLSTPSILARIRTLSAATEAEIARVIAEDTAAEAGDPRPRIVASILMTLSHLSYFPSDDDVDTARRRIEQGFALLADGLAGYATRR
jgi:AcrR family transcriptional regulator